MIKAHRGDITLEGTFHQLLAELSTIVIAMEESLEKDTKLKELFKNKSVLELITETSNMRKQMKTSGLSPEDFLNTLPKQ
jgi:hypothetical protein